MEAIKASGSRIEFTASKSAKQIQAEARRIKRIRAAGYELSWEEIADRLGISVETAIQIALWNAFNTYSRCE